MLSPREPGRRNDPATTTRSSAAVRGSDRQRFLNPGSATLDASIVPFVLVSNDVAQRNIGL